MDDAKTELNWQQLHEADDKLAEANQEIASLRARLDAAEQERDTLKVGILAELGGGNSLPDFWTAERQLPFVAKALAQARQAQQWQPISTCPPNLEVAFCWTDGVIATGYLADFKNDIPAGWFALPAAPATEK